MCGRVEVVADRDVGAGRRAPGPEIALGATSVPFKGGTFLIDAVALQVPLAVGGVPAQAGVGDLGFPILLDDALFVGLDLFWQVGFVDAGAVLGVSLTNGLRVQAG